MVATAQGPASSLQLELLTLLSGEMKFSSSELADLQAGKIVAHGLGAAAEGEISAVGAVRVHVRRDIFVERYRDIVSFKRGANVIQIGRFSRHPGMEDLAGLTLNKEDVDLRSCRVGACDIRLPAATIGRFQREIDWKARDADARAALLFKQVLLEHVQAYLFGGPGRIIEYNDEKRTVRPVDDFAALLKGSPYLGRLAPGLPDHLKTFPADPLNGAEDFLYWSKEKFGFTPFITVTQVTIAPSTSTSTVIVSKDVYSSRYFDASLTLTVASDDLGTKDQIYLVYMNRSRANALKGAFSALRRSMVEGRVKSSLRENLRAVKLRLEGNP